MKKHFWVYLLIFVFTFSFSVASNEADNKSREEYLVYQLVPGKIFIIYAKIKRKDFIDGWVSTIPAFAEGLKEISQTHIIKNIVSVALVFRSI